MSEFIPAVEYVLKNEGGLSENPKDPGGITNFGISLRFLKNVSPENVAAYGVYDPVDANSIRDLTEAQAVKIYQGEFWAAEPWETIRSQSLCNYVFDMAVSMGIGTAIKCVQRALRSCLLDRTLKVDAILGPNTQHYINITDNAVLMAALRSERMSVYRLRVQKNIDLACFMDGWEARALMRCD